MLLPVTKPINNIITPTEITLMHWVWVFGEDIWGAFGILRAREVLERVEPVEDIVSAVFPFLFVGEV